jgi:hypothetical protein
MNTRDLNAQLILQTIILHYYHVTNGGQPTVERVKKYHC